MLRRICITILAATLSLCLIPCSAIAESYWDDPHPPTLSSIAVDRAVASVGDTVRISWDVQDADGVKSVRIYMTSQDPSHKDPSSPGSWWISSTDDTTKGFSYNIRSTDSPGKRWIVGLEVYDKAGYVTDIWDSTYRTSVEEGDLLADMSAAVFEIVENDGDPHPPTLSSIAVDRAVASVGDTVRISWDVQDADGVKSVRIYMTSQDPSHKDPSSPGSWWISSTDDTTTGFSYNIRSTDSPGKRWIVGLEVYDKAGYVTDIWDSTYRTSVEEGDLLADMSAAVFEIVENTGDPNPPTLSSIAVDRPVASVGDTVRISWDVQDADGVKSVRIYMTSQDPSHKDPSSPGSWWISSTDDTTKGFSYNIKSTDSPGKRWIVGLEVYDKAGYVTDIWDSTYRTSVEEGDLLADMSAAVFEIVDPTTVPIYSILEGNSSVYTPGSNAGLTFRFNGPLEKFMHLEIDGAVVPSLYYALKEGSTIVILNPAYLDQMDAGAHTITAHYTDGGRAVAVFAIQPKINEKGDGPSSEAEEKAPPQPNDQSNSGLPQTGDTTPLWLLFGICFIALGMMTASFFCMKRTRTDT